MKKENGVHLLYSRLRSLELSATQLTDEEAEDLRTHFESLACSEEFEVKKISELKKHIKKDMSPELLGFLLIPIERYLQKNIEDSDFLVARVDRTQPQSEKIPLVLVLNNLRSAFNVGSLLRSAECLNIQEVILCGYTPAPDNKKTARSTMGTEDLVTWRKESNLESSLKELHEKGFHIVGLETVDKALSWDKPYPQKPCALLLGNERFGIEERHLKMCSEIRKLPTRGQKNSLNVAVAGATAMYEWYRQWK